MTCASTNSSDSPELTVLARLRDRGNAGDEDTRVSITAGTEIFSFPLAGTPSQGLATFTSSVPIGTTLNATATSGTTSSHASCVVAAGLSEISPAARAVEGGARVSWPIVEEALAYRLAALDFTTNEVLATTTATASPETLSFEAAPDHLIVIDFIADSLEHMERPLPAPLPNPRRLHRRVLLSAGRDGGSGEPWQLFGPGDFVGGKLQIRYPRLVRDERVALILSNAGGLDLGSREAPAAVVEVRGTLGPVSSEKQGERSAIARAPLSRILSDPAFRDYRPAHVQALRAAARPPPESSTTPQVGDRKGLCAADWTHESTHGFKRVPATVQHRSAHAAFWVDDRAQAAFDAALADLPSLWLDLASSYEAHVLPALRTYFGRESDINNDGVMSFLFTDLGPPTEWGLVGGFFDYHDYNVADTTDDCNGADPTRGANGMDILYLRDLGSFAQHSDPPLPLQFLVNELYPNLMAHELQHNINFNHRWLAPERPEHSVSEESWLNEALSQLAQDVAGYGLNSPPEREQVAAYLRTYSSFSLTTWQGSYGNYAGGHAFLRYFADRLGPALTLRLQDPRLGGKANFGAATGVPFDLALAQFATASLFSNEPFSPGAAFDYQGMNWTPWHALVGPAAYTLAMPSRASTIESLRGDGWQALVTSTGGDEQVSITVQTTAARPFYVVAVRFAGALP